MTTRILLIGDVHIKRDDLKQCGIFLDAMYNKTKTLKPDLVLFLGDVLNDHGNATSYQFNMLIKMIVRMRQIAPVAILMGNHDFADEQQYCSEAHFYNAFKRWKDVMIVDKPMTKTINKHTLVFCPYVSKRKFKSTLDKLLEQNISWDLADAIFAHQEFKGGKMGHAISIDGDEWDESLPHVYSGHLHEAQTPQPNITYIGSSREEGFADTSEKRLVLLEIGPDGEHVCKKIDLEIKRKKIVRLDVSNVDKFDKTLLNKYEIKLELVGDKDAILAFKKSAKCKELKKDLGKYLVFDTLVPDVSVVQTKAKNLADIIDELVKSKNSPSLQMLHTKIKTRVFK
jgi:DNA repair exonuclease SbcCD nuclease subunit